MSEILDEKRVLANIYNEFQLHRIHNGISLQRLQKLSGLSLKRLGVTLDRLQSKNLIQIGYSGQEKIVKLTSRGVEAAKIEQVVTKSGAISLVSGSVTNLFSDLKAGFEVRSRIKDKDRQSANNDAQFNTKINELENKIGVLQKQVVDLVNDVSILPRQVEALTPEKELSKFVRYLSSIWGKLSSLSIVFPFSNLFIKIIPLPYDASLHTLLAMLFSMYSIYFVFISRTYVDLHHPQNVRTINYASILSFFLGLFGMAFFSSVSGMYYEALKFYSLIIYSISYGAITASFTLLSVLEYMKNQ